jgi:hypothetical protein
MSSIDRLHQLGELKYPERTTTLSRVPPRQPRRGADNRVARRGARPDIAGWPLKKPKKIQWKQEWLADIIKYWGGASDPDWDGTPSLPAKINGDERAAFFAAHPERMEKLRRTYCDKVLHERLSRVLENLRRDIKAGKVTSVSTNTSAGSGKDHSGRFTPGKLVSPLQPCRRAGAVGTPAICHYDVGPQATMTTGHRPLTSGWGAGQACLSCAWPRLGCGPRHP